jgi:hypothetical protein
MHGRRDYEQLRRQVVWSVLALIVFGWSLLLGRARLDHDRGPGGGGPDCRALPQLLSLAGKGEWRPAAGALPRWRCWWRQWMLCGRCERSFRVVRSK